MMCRLYLLLIHHPLFGSSRGRTSVLQRTDVRVPGSFGSVLGKIIFYVLNFTGIKYSIMLFKIKFPTQAREGTLLLCIRCTCILFHLAQEDHAGGIVALGGVAFQFDVEGSACLEGIQSEAVGDGLLAGLDGIIGLDLRHQFVALP